jgi:hypothetical protein
MSIQIINHQQLNFVKVTYLVLYLNFMKEKCPYLDGISGKL